MFHFFYTKTISRESAVFYFLKLQQRFWYRKRIVCFKCNLGKWLWNQNFREKTRTTKYLAQNVVDNITSWFYLKSHNSFIYLLWIFTVFFYQSLGQSLSIEDTVENTVKQRKKRCSNTMCDTQIWKLRHQLDMALLKIENLQNQLR